MVLVLNILIIVSGVFTAIISLTGDTWKKNEKVLLKKLTKKGHLALLGYVAFTILSIWKEVYITQQDLQFTKDTKYHSSINELLNAYMNKTINDVYIRINLDYASIQDKLNLDGFVQASLQFYFNNNKLDENENTILDFYLLPSLKLYSLHPAIVSKFNKSELIRHKDKGDFLFLYKNISDNSWNIVAINDLSEIEHNNYLHFSIYEYFHPKPTSISYFVGEELQVIERDSYATGPSIITFIEFSLSQNSKLPFLRLIYRHSEKYGAGGHQVYNWMPQRVKLAAPIVSGHYPPFLYDLNYLRESLVTSLKNSYETQHEANDFLTK